MPTNPIAVEWLRNRGQNGWDALVDVPLDQSVSSRNVHLFDGGLGTRRGGSVSLTITGVTAPINALIEYIPGQDETAAELFAVDNSATTKILRCAAGSSFSNLTLADNVATAPTMVSAAVLNGKLYLAYDSTVNRLHVFDPGYSTTTVRRAGMGTPAAPTAADGGGAGAYAATARYYRVAFTEQRSGVTVRRSLLSPSLSKTPDGAHANLTVTKPSSISEGETHWEVYGSTDDALYYLLSTIAVGTTTYADTEAPADYAGHTAAPAEGANTPFPSVKSLGTDGSRLYGLGVWETSAGDSLTPVSGRFYFSPVLDSSGVHDDERISNTTTIQGFIDLARNVGGTDRGVTPRPVNNVIFAFQSTGVYGLYPTGSATVPFRRVVVSSQVGNLAQQAIVMAHDRNGAPCAYFLDPVKGPYVVGGSDGLKWCGKDVATDWATVNRDASTIAAWGVFHSDMEQVIFAVATGGSATPNLALVLDVTEQEPDEKGDLRSGWTVYDGDFVASRCGVVFSNTLNATRARTKVPYTGGNSKLLRYDPSVDRDDTTSFQAYVTSGSLVTAARNIQLDRAYTVADAASGVSIRHRLIRNSGAENRDSTLTLTADGTETIVMKKADDAAMQEAWTVQVSLGDAAAANVNWHLYQWRGSLSVGADR